MSKKIKQPKQSKETKQLEEIKYSITNEFIPELDDKYWDKIDENINKTT